MRSRLFNFALASAMCAATGSVYAQSDPDMAAARAANAAARAGINAGATAAIIPGYHDSLSLRQPAGHEDLQALARQRLAACAANSADATCEAQRAAVESAALPKAVIAQNDPDVAAARAVADNPFGNASELADYYRGCSADGRCNENRFCLGDKCFDTDSPRDPDFAQAMTFMEAAREAGVYLDTTTMKVFSGEGNRCRERLLKNCCHTNEAGAGLTNSAMFGVGSRLVYDLLMNSGNRRFITQGMQALLTSNAFSGTFTTYGITIAANGAALPAGSVSLMATNNAVIAFNPWTLAISVVMYAAVSMTTCNQEEGKLAMKEGAKLCHRVGTWCSSCTRVLGKCVACIERTTSKCCFNSRLARIINEQARAQFGMGWGSPQRPQCAGFTVAQLQQLDFARMDLSEFYASIIPTPPDTESIKTRQKNVVGKCQKGQGKC